jgi:SAM-dependent methyltransferase
LKFRRSTQIKVNFYLPGSLGIIAILGIMCQNIIMETILAFGILLAIILFLVLVFAPTIYAGIIGAPLLCSPKNAIRKMLSELEIKEGQKLYDLGCGSGRILMIADKEFGLKTVGYELSPAIYWFARINLFFNKAERSKVFKLNAYGQNLSDADIVFCFLSVRAMKRLKEKFLRELRPGTKIISYAFAIKGWEPEKVITGFPGKVYLYRMKN